MIGASLADWGAVAICAGASIACGPAWPACITTCVEGGVLIEEDAIFPACLTGAIGIFAGCELKTNSQLAFAQ